MSDLVHALLAGDEGVVVATEITLGGRGLPGHPPRLGWPNLLIVRLQTSPRGKLEIKFAN